MPALEKTLKAELDALASRHLLRARCVTHSDGAYIEREGKRYLSFASNDYFGLAGQAASITADQGAGASAMVTGYSGAHQALERTLTEAKGTEAALLFGSGYLANIGTITALVGKGDLILADKLAHACMIDGAQLSGATLRRFKHNDMAHLAPLLSKRGEFRRCLILTETVFSMDGDRAPLSELAELAKQHDAWLMTDDAHGLGMIDANPAAIQMGTLSKGIGAYGGYICGSQMLINYLANQARSYLFTTALPPSICEVARASLAELLSDDALRAKPLARARQFTQALGLPKAQSPIVPLIIGENEAALSAQKQLADAGFWVPAIRPPTVPEGTARLRFSFTALHNSQQIETVVKEVQKYGWHKSPNA